MVQTTRYGVVVFMGLTGSGKSFLAGKWVARHGWPYCNSDIIRKELAGVEPTRGCHAVCGAGIYTESFSRRTYAVMRQRARLFLAGQRKGAVVLDGSYILRKERQAVWDMFAGEKVFFVLCHCSEEMTRERLQRRQNDPAAVSDGTLEVYRMQLVKYEYPEEIPSTHMLKLDTACSVEYLIERLDSTLLRQDSISPEDKK